MFTLSFNTVSRKRTSFSICGRCSKELTVGAQYRITEAKAPAGYTLLPEPVEMGALTAESPDITVTACNNANFALPFTGSHGFIAPLLFAALMLSMGVYFCRKSDLKKENH